MWGGVQGLLQGLREVVQRLRLLVALPEDQDSIARTHTVTQSCLQTSFEEI